MKQTLSHVFTFAGTFTLAALLLCACEKSSSCTFNPNTNELACAEKTYKTVQTGGNIWLAENVSYLDLTGTGHCYNDSAKNCELYGSLVPYETALKICPEGWTLPTQADFEKADIKSLNVINAGFRYYDGKFADLGKSASFWTAEAFDESRAILVRVTDKVSYEHFNKSIDASVRCIKK